MRIAGARRMRPWGPVALAALLVACAVGVPASSAEPVARDQGDGDDPAAAIRALLVRPTSDQLVALAGSTAVDDLPGSPSEPADGTSFGNDIATVLETLPARDWTVAGLAGSLGTDPAAAFAFVRDSIRYEPYAGVLRGAGGTLAAGAGNSFDQSLLLGAILGSMGFGVRYAIGQLDPADAERLVMRSLQPPVAPRPDVADLALLPLDPTRVAGRARRDYALLARAMGPRLQELAPDPIWQASIASAVQHAWVQVLRDGTWLDLDPSGPDLRPGQTLAAAGTVVDSFGPELQQSIVVRIVAEMLSDEGPWEQVVLEQALPAAASMLSDPELLFLPADADGGVGLFGGLGSGTLFAPVLVQGDSVSWGTPFQAEDVVDDSGGLGFGGGGSSWFLGLRLDVQTDAPGQPPVSATRLLLDRVPASMRRSGQIDPAGIAPLVLGANGPEALSWIHHLMVSNGGADVVDRVVEQGAVISLLASDGSTADDLASWTLGALLWPQAIADRALVVASERVAVPAADIPGRTHGFIGRPRVYLASIGPDPAGGGAVAQRTDLLIDGLDVLDADGATAEARLWYGAVMGAIETEHGLSMLQGVDPSPGTRDSASLRMGEALTVLSRDDLPTLGDDAPGGVREILEAGGWAVLPGSVADARGWWEIRPDGSARAMLEPRLGGWETFPGTGKASVYHFQKPGSVRVPAHETPTGKVRAQPGTEYELVLNGVAIPGPIAVTWLGTAIAFLLAWALDQLLLGGAGFRCRSCQRRP